MAVVHFDLTQDFPAGLNRLWHALGRADYIERKYRSLGSTAVRILTLNVDEKSIEVELDRRAPVAREALPAWARSFTAKSQAMRHHTRWRRAGRDRVDAELDIRAAALRVGAKGTGSIVEIAPDHSRMTLHFDVTSDAPALQTSIARVFARQVQHALQADHAFTLEYLRAATAQPSM